MSATTPWERGRLDARRGKPRLLFGRMYEDWEIEAEVLPASGRVFCIASAGSTGMALAARGLAVTAVDINPAQVDYVRDRLRGGAPRAGTADRFFAAGRRFLPLMGLHRSMIRRFLELTDSAAQVRYWHAHLDTALVATTHVCYRNGFKINAAALAEVAHERGALLLLDAFQSLGTQPVDVKALGLDFMVTGALKYLLGTPGIAFLYVRDDLVERFQPSDSGWFAQEQVFAYDVHHLDYARSARRFETGSPPVPNAYATLAALRLLASVGLPAIERHV